MTRGPRRLHAWTWARRIVAAGFLALLCLGRFEWFPWFRGTVSGTSVLRTVPIVDPLAAIEVSLATREIAGDVLLGAGILVAIALLLGPVFCGWLCPLGFLLDLNQGAGRVAHRLIRRRPHEPRPGPVPPAARYAVLAATAAFAVAAREPLFQALSPINLFVRGVVLAAGPGLAVVAAIALVEHRWPRLWCRALCPLGALYGLAGRVAPFRVRIDRTVAGRTPCRQCTRECPMGIRVMEDYALAGRASIDDPACSRCGGCADVCPHDVLRLGFRAFSGATACDDKPTRVVGLRVTCPPASGTTNRELETTRRPGDPS